MPFEPDNGKRERMLIIDREQMICELLQYKFSSEGFDVDILNDGYKALQTDLSDTAIVLADLMDQQFTGARLHTCCQAQPRHL